MIALGIVLTAIGGADILRVLIPGRWNLRRRLTLLSTFCLAILLISGLLAQLPWWVFLLAAVTIALWLCAVRIGPPLPLNSVASSPRRQSTLIIVFLLLSATLTVTTEFAVALPPYLLHPLSVLNGETLILATGLVLFLIVSANALVRAALRYDADPQDQKDPKHTAPTHLKGGRWIGPLERITLAGLLVFGAHPVAAGLIAAKGIVRFPEIQADQQHGNKAEYFLVGSFVSWTLAIAAAGIFHMAAAAL